MNKWVMRMQTQYFHISSSRNLAVMKSYRIKVMGIREYGVLGKEEKGGAVAIELLRSRLVDLSGT